MSYFEYAGSTNGADRSMADCETMAANEENKIMIFETIEDDVIPSVSAKALEQASLGPREMNFKMSDIAVTFPKPRLGVKLYVQSIIEMAQTVIQEKTWKSGKYDNIEDDNKKVTKQGVTPVESKTAEAEHDDSGLKNMSKMVQTKHAQEAKVMVDGAECVMIDGDNMPNDKDKQVRMDEVLEDEVPVISSIAESTIEHTCMSLRGKNFNSNIAKPEKEAIPKESNDTQIEILQSATENHLVVTDIQTESDETETQKDEKLDRDDANRLKDYAGNDPDNMDFNFQLFVESAIKDAEAGIFQSSTENNWVNTNTQTQRGTNETQKEDEKIDRNDTNRMEDNVGNDSDSMDFNLKLFVESVIKNAEAELLKSPKEDNQVNTNAQTEIDDTMTQKRRKARQEQCQQFGRKFRQ